jgi:predicted  nucleic acid-binding Zn-ribbon protein
MSLEKIRITVSAVFAIALIYLATNIIFFTKEISTTRSAIVDIGKQIEKIESSKNLGRIITEVNKISTQIPLIISEVEVVRKLVPPLIHEVEQTRETIPSILEEVAKVRETIPSILEEVAKVRETIPPILKESEALRADIPVAIQKAQDLVNSGKDLSKEAGSSAVHGAVKGIITEPIDILESGVKRLVPE